MRFPVDLRHWPEYLIEAAALGLFMVSAATFTVVLEHPDFPARAAIETAWVRRLLMGLAMAGTAAIIIYSPFGARSGAHMNPAVTLTFLRLGKIAPVDAACYVLMHFAGAIAGLALVGAGLRSYIAHPSVNYVATLPGLWGAQTAFAAEVAISFVLMAVLLTVSASRHARWTGAAAATLIALYIFLEAPVSGTSLNPARSFAPALISGNYSAIWIYFAAPVLGMSLAAEWFIHRRGLDTVRCTKLNHPTGGICQFCCGAPAAATSTTSEAA